MPVALEARVSRDAHTVLDGTFLAWANPPADASQGGEYPFAFDCPDAATHEGLSLPCADDRADSRVRAAARGPCVRDRIQLAQAAQGLAFAARLFIPSRTDFASRRAGHTAGIPCA